MINANVKKLAICGELRSGKSLLTGMLVNKYRFQPFAFGDALKRQAHAAFPWIPRNPKPRALYQAFGQAVRGLPVEGAEDVWVRHVMRDIDDFIKRARAQAYADPATLQQPRVVVSDLRQPNEFSMLKDDGFTIIRVTAPLDLRLQRAREEGDNFTEADAQHDTETHVAGFDADYEIANNGAVSDLEAQVDAVMAALGVPEWRV
jgi:dephospho-CoA kinase